MLKDLDGRTLKGLKRQKAALQTRAMWIDEATELEAIEHRLEVCKLLRPAYVVTTTEGDETVDAAITELAPFLNNDEIPSEVVHTLLGRTIQKFKRQIDVEPKKLEHATNPWSSGAFDLKLPIVATLPKTGEEAKVTICARIMYRETLVPLVLKGQPDVQIVKNLRSTCLEQLNSIDIIDLTPIGLQAVKEFTCVWEYLTALLSPKDGFALKAVVM